MRRGKDGDGHIWIGFTPLEAYVVLLVLKEVDLSTLRDLTVSKVNRMARDMERLIGQQAPTEG